MSPCDFLQLERKLFGKLFNFFLHLERTQLDFDRLVKEFVHIAITDESNLSFLFVILCYASIYLLWYSQGSHFMG